MISSPGASPAKKTKSSPYKLFTSKAFKRGVKEAKAANPGLSLAELNDFGRAAFAKAAEDWVNGKREY